MALTTNLTFERPARATVTTRTADEVSGSYTENGTELVFRLYRDGDVRFAVLSTRDGKPFIESEYKDGVDRARILGGRLVEHGAVHDDATLEGDKAALDEMLALPEAKLVAPMKDALTDAGVNPFLVGRETKEASAGSVQPNAFFDGSWWHLSYWEQASFPTWSFWGWTTVSMEPYGGDINMMRSCVELSVSGCPEYLCSDPSAWSPQRGRSISRQWGGARLYVRNTGYWTRYKCGNWSNGGWCTSGPSCGSAPTVRVRTY